MIKIVMKVIYVDINSLIESFVTLSCRTYGVLYAQLNF